MNKNNSRTYSYYLDLFGCGIYDFTEKERCIKDYCIYMLDRTQRMFEYKGLPDTIPKRMLEYQLQVYGFTCIAEHNGELYAYWGGLGGEPDEYYRPTVCVVANPAQKLNKTFKIDEDCVIVRNDSFFIGMMPLFRRYATAMTENDLSFKLASINSRIQALITAPDDTTKEAGVKYLEDIEAGRLGVIASNEFLDGLKAQPVQGSMRTFTDLIEYQQYLKASWYNEIGLNANYNMKREKLSTTESQMNSDALLPLVDDMLEQRRLGVERINEMFGTNISVDFASSWVKLVEEIESNQLDSGGEMDETGADSGNPEETDSGTDSSRSERTDGSGEEISEVSGEKDIRSTGEELWEDGTQRESDEKSDGGNAESDETGDGTTGDGEPENGEDLSTQLDSGNVEVNVEVTVVTNDEREEDADRSVGEDDDKSGDNL